MEYYKLGIKEVFKELETGEKGLSGDEAKARLQKYGLNQIEEKEKISPIKILLSQFNSPVIWVLLGAVIISVFLKETIDAIVIMIILILNAIVGFIQEYNAERAIEALRKMASLKAVVIRDGNEKEIDAAELVPGDIIILTTGEKIPADARLIEVINLQAQEAALTGESVPISKNIAAYDKDLGIGDRKNMVYSGTIITNGRGKAIVTGTGMRTEIGNIAHLIQTTTSDLTPLQKQLKHLGKWLGILTLIICIMVFSTGVLKGEPILEFFIVAVSLAVAAIPEGLPAVVTIALALGVKRMVKRNALMRKLPSVETLGCTTVICSDKTGTLTHNEMTVKKIFVDNEVIDVSGSGYGPKGTFSNHTKTLPMLLKIGALNNDAKLEEKEGAFSVIGDPTEGSLIVSAAKAGLDKSLLENKHKRIDEVEFTSERKRMTTIHEINGNRYSFVKGAPDIILKLCSYIEINGKVRKITKEDRTKILKMNEYFAKQALRVLGFAYKKLRKGEKKEDYEKDLTFVGLQGMIDPPREEVKEAIAKCKRAGIKVVMITGDYRGTALAIAKELGIEGKAVGGDEIDKINLDEEVLNISVYARVNPEHKLKIVEALKKKGHIVAMTGDGVNDAPALKKADIGIAMGITGTDVAKEASDMILLDDNFTSIVNAVEEGRTIYDNIRKFVEYMLSSNVGEVLTLFTAIMIGLPLPLIAVMLLWINLATDGAPALALGVDPSEKGVMERPPRKTKAKIVDLNKGIYMFCIGAIMMAGTLWLFSRYKPDENLAYAQTIAFATLVLFQMFNVLNCRNDEISFFRTGIFSNKWLIGAVLLSLALQMVVIYTPLSVYFKTVEMTIMDWAYALAVSSSVLWFGEIVKIAKKIFSTRKSG